MPYSHGPLTFETSEHACQFRACEEHKIPDIAEQVFKAKTPREAKYIAVYIKEADPSSHWNITKYVVMGHVFMEKVDSSESVCEYLLESNNKHLVEATSEMYWASGLSYNLTITTHSSREISWLEYVRKTVQWNQIIIKRTFCCQKWSSSRDWENPGWICTWRRSTAFNFFNRTNINIWHGNTCSDF